MLLFIVFMAWIAQVQSKTIRPGMRSVPFIFGTRLAGKVSFVPSTNERPHFLEETKFK